MAASDRDRLLALIEARSAEVYARLCRYPAAGAADGPHEAFAELLGELWLQLQQSEHPEREWSMRLRRASYRACEAPRRRRHHSWTDSLTNSLASPDPAPDRREPRSTSLPSWVPRGRVRLSLTARQLGWSRRRLRLELTRLAQELSDGAFLLNLKRRSARWHAAVARDGLTRAHELEARHLLRVLSLIEAPAELADLVPRLRRMIRAPRTTLPDPGSPEPASESWAPRAKA